MASYPVEVASLLVLVTDLFLSGKPHEVGGLLVLAVILDEFADDADPSLIGAIGLEQHAIAYTTLEISHARPDDLAARHLPPFPVALGLVGGRAVGVLGVVDPLPG